MHTAVQSLRRRLHTHSLTHDVHAHEIRVRLALRAEVQLRDAAGCHILKRASDVAARASRVTERVPPRPCVRSA